MATYTNLSIGSQGDDVKKLQKALGITADGIYGSQTQAAVKAYQQKNGLSVDGIAGNQTLGKLYGTAAKTTPTTTAKSTTGTNLSGLSSSTKAGLDQYSKGYTPSDTVKAAQQYLQELQGKKPGEYQSPWEQQLNEMYDKIMNREDFTYDVADDPLYQQYREQYTRLGQQAMMDTMGQAAGLTGGYGSTYSQNAGQQAYQGYLQQLNDIVPELYGQAYERYRDEGADLLNRYGLVQQNDERDYGRYRDTVGDYYNDYNLAYQRAQDERNFDYGQWGDMLSYFQQLAGQENGDYWNRTQFDYQKQRDAIADEQWAKEFALAQQRAAASGGGGGGGGGDTYKATTKAPSISSTGKQSASGLGTTDFSNLKKTIGVTFSTNPTRAVDLAISSVSKLSDNQAAELSTLVSNAYKSGKISEAQALAFLDKAGA